MKKSTISRMEPIKDNIDREEVYMLQTDESPLPRLTLQRQDNSLFDAKKSQTIKSL